MNEVALQLKKFWQGVCEFWQGLPRKWIFFSLLLCTIAFFHFYGNSTYGYLIGRVKYMRSLFAWLYNAYTAELADDSHGLIMPFVILGLFYWKRERLLKSVGGPWLGGLVIFAVGLVLHIIGFMIQQTRLSAVGFFICVYGLMGAVWGRGWLSESFFPYFLFVFCIPLGSMGDAISFRLRLIVTKAVVLLSHYVFGVDVIAEGTRLLSPDRLFEYEVAAPCSGIRSLIAIIAVSIIYGWVSFRRVTSRLALLAVAPPLAVIGNICRMMLIILAAEVGGQEAGLKVHESTILSLIPYVPGFLGLGLIGMWIKKTWEGEK